MATRFPKISSKNICKWERSSPSPTPWIPALHLTALPPRLPTPPFLLRQAVLPPIWLMLLETIIPVLPLPPGFPAMQPAVLENQDTEIYIPFSHCPSPVPVQRNESIYYKCPPENKRQRKPGKRQAAIPINKLLHLPQACIAPPVFCLQICLNPKSVN